MSQILDYVWVAILFCPILVLIISYFVLKKLRMKQVYVIGFSADITTLLLFLSVPFIVQQAWSFSVYIIVIIIAIIVALIFTFIDWRTKKEIEVPKLMKKIWRVYFVGLLATYIIVATAAIIKYVITTMKI